MTNKSKSTALIFVLIAVVIFVLGIFVVAELLPDDTEPQSDYGVRFESFDVTVEWKDDRSCTVTQVIDARFDVMSHGIYVDIPVNSGEKVRDLKIETTPDLPCKIEREGGNKIIRARVGDPDRYFRSGSGMTCVVTYECITPEHPSDKNILAFNAIGGGWTNRTEKATVTMIYPAAPEKAGDEYGIWVGGKKVAEGGGHGVNVAWSADGRTVTVTVEDRSNGYALDAFEAVELAYKMPEGVLKAHSDTEYLYALIGGIILALAAVPAKIFVKNKPLTPIVDYYPPRIDGINGDKRHMLPVQMGKIVDGSCSPSDVTSLIFHWASNGYLAISERDGETYFAKLKEIDAVTRYERDMFNKLFDKAVVENDEQSEFYNKPVISMDKLKGKFAASINATKTAVDAEYRGKLYKKSGIVICAGMYLLSFLFGACAVMLTSLRVGGSVYAMGGVIAFIPQVFAVLLGIMLTTYYPKLSATKRKAYTVIYCAASVAIAAVAVLLAPVDVMSVLEKIFVVIGWSVPSALAPFFILRTPFYDEQLNAILGFRDFLRDAEKERLEALLEENPQYYYDILPYANVLGVSDIWQDKFKALTIEPPKYYYGCGVDVFDLMILNSLLHNVGSTLTYVPPKSNSGSFSGKGHGGGGGFSGGSFGGGGGGRW